MMNNSSQKFNRASTGMREQQQQQQQSHQQQSQHYNNRARWSQPHQKRRRSTLWETITGLVCSLGALATRAAKMTARRTDSL